jgi:hypothetical protein
MMLNIKGALKRYLKAAFTFAFEQDSFDIERWRQRNALQETGKFVEENMSRLQSSDSRYALMKVCCNRVKHKQVPGLICEFGVAEAKSINYLAKQLPDKKLYGFDSFEGLPEDWMDGLPKGTFKVKQLPAVQTNVELIKGWFDDTLQPFLDAHPEPIALLHVDCDLYRSAKVVLEGLKKRIQTGSIIIFDEFFNYPGWKENEFKAFNEFIKKNDFKYEYLGYNRYGKQVAVIIT